jgi:Ca2+/H+ antiporter, TMEM165/GDT1 family
MPDYGDPAQHDRARDVQGLTQAMTGLFFALLATLVAGIGARDQLLVAQLSAQQGPRPSLLLVALASGIAASVAAAWGGAQVAELLGGRPRLLLAAMALILAGLEMMFVTSRPSPAEPTHSLGAFAVVIFATQLTDAARFLVFATAVLTRAPLTSGLGGVIGAGLVVTLGWLAVAFLRSPRLVWLRRGLGLILLLIGVALGPTAIG